MLRQEENARASSAFTASSSRAPIARTASGASVKEFSRYDLESPSVRNWEDHINIWQGVYA